MTTKEQDECRRAFNRWCDVYREGVKPGLFAKMAWDAGWNAAIRRPSDDKQPAQGQADNNLKVRLLAAEAALKEAQESLHGWFDSRGSIKPDMSIASKRELAERAEAKLISALTSIERYFQEGKV